MKKLRILVVDDNRDFAETLADVLSLRGHSVTIADSGDGAIQEFRCNAYDLTLMDVKLPGKNGVESFLEIRKIRPDAKVVMMTGYSVEELIKQAIDNGALEVIYKPFKMDRVLNLIGRMRPEGMILVADDDPDFVRTVGNILEAAGYKVLVARNGREAVTRIEKNSVDLLILDLRLPILNGLEVYLELKKLGHALPTIIVTAYADEEFTQLDALHNFEVTGVLKKPFDPRVLLSSVEKLLVG